MERVGFVALLVTTIVPLAEPATIGANVAVRVFDVPAAKVNGVDTGVRENPVPEIETPETVTGAPPELVTVTVRDEEVLRFTLPKLTEAGDAESVPAFTPVPLKGIDRLGLDPLLVTLMAPLAEPATFGASVAVRAFDAPAAKVNGVETGVRENPFPEMETPETVTDAPPVLVIVTLRDAEVLTVTFPKLKEVGEGVSAPCVVVLEDTIVTAA